MNDLLRYQLSQEITSTVIRSLRDRKGFDELWYEIDADIRLEILQEISDEIDEVLSGNGI